ncbi:MAG: ABC transporter substrate-binding protein [Victivallaceae bacterium]|nr:ABC transporter substrate-binding protein [Victivallaceae bacterium]
MKILFPAVLFFAAATFVAAAPMPVRVVSVSPVTTEIICALGAFDCLVGRSSACDYPATVKTLPVSGDFGTIYAEKTALLNPTLVVSTELYRPVDRRMLEQLGIKYELFKDDSIEDYFSAVARLGELVGRKPEAAMLIASGRAALRRLEAAPRPEREPRVLILAGIMPLYAAGGRGYLAEAVKLAGGNNAASTFQGAFTPVSPEWVAAGNIEIILPVGHGITLDGLATLPGLAGVPAIRNHQVIAGEIPESLARPGPRLFCGIEKLRDYFLAFSAASSAALSRETGKKPLSTMRSSDSREVKFLR